MRKGLVLFSAVGFALCSNIVFAGKVAGEKQAADPVIATLGAQKITASDFNRFYTKSANVPQEKNNVEDSVKARREFLDMLINYRLKLAEAYRLHYDTDPEITGELHQYEKNISASYYLDHQLVEPNVRMLYDRRQIELHAAHIYIMISPRRNYPPEDTVKPFAKAMDVLAQAMAGVPFDSLVAKYSDDQTTRVRNGDLGYFSMGAMLPQIEDACYSLKPGEVADHLARTVAGYHIIKLLDRGPARPDRMLSHIMISVGQNDTPADTLRKYQKMEAILDSIRHGISFAELARRNSEDPTTAADGGALGVITRNQIKIFDNVIFGLKIGEPSPIVRSAVGYHILMVTKDVPYGTYEEKKDEIRGLYKRMRYDSDYRELIRSLKNEYHAVVDDSTILRLQKALDSTLSTSKENWDSVLTASDRSLVLFRYDGGPVAVDSLVSFLKTGTEFRGSLFKPQTLTRMVQKLVEMCVLEYKTRNLETESPEFAAIMREYREGLMIYKLDQENVWKKVTIDDKALRRFYKIHKSEYRFGDRVDFSEISAPNDSIANCMLDSLKAGVPFDSLAARHTTRLGMKAKCGRWGMTDVAKSALTRIAYTMDTGVVSPKPIKDDVGYSIIIVHTKDPARIKTFDEASSELSARYQEEMTKKLDSAYVRRLRNKTRVTINEKLFAQLYAKK